MTERTVPILAVLFTGLLLAGCGEPEDRMVTADGLAVAGELSGIEGGTVSFVDSRSVTNEWSTARIYLVEKVSIRGTVTFGGDLFTISSGGEGQTFEAAEIEMIVWSDPSTEAETVLDVLAWDGWVDSGIDVMQGDLLTVSATGTVTMKTGTCGPEGIEMHSTTTALVPGATNGQLVMRTGDVPPVAVGAGWIGPAPGSGELQFAVNLPDSLPEPGDGGLFRVVMVRSDGPGPGTAVLYPAAR